MLSYHLKNIIKIFIVLSFYVINDFSYALTVNNNVSFYINNLANKYCNSQKDKLFIGLESEFLLKYKYYFSDIPKGIFSSNNFFLENLNNEVYSICNLEINNNTKREFIRFLEVHN